MGHVPVRGLGAQNKGLAAIALDATILWVARVVVHDLGGRPLGADPACSS